MTLIIPLGTETANQTYTIDGKVYRPLLVDSSGRTIIIGDGAGNSIVVSAADLDIRALVKTQDELYAVLRTEAGVAYDARDRSWTVTETVPVKNPTAGQLIATIQDSGGEEADIFGEVENHGQLTMLGTHSRGRNWNGAGWDRLRGNTSFTLLASTARTASISTADQVNYNASALYIFIDITAVPGAGSLTLHITVKDPASGKYVSIFTSAALSAVALSTYVVGLGVGGAGFGVTAIAAFPVPRDWRITIIAATGDSYTYSVGGMLVL